VPMAPFFQVEMVVAVAEMLKEIQLVLGQLEDFNHCFIMLVIFKKEL
jgi:hypothetical protein